MATVAKAKANGVVDDAAQLFARRIARLDAVSIQLRHLHREWTQCLLAEKQAKAHTYLNSEARSHGEREGQASAFNVALSTESLLLRGEITALEEERDHLRFLIEHDAGG